MPLPQTQINEPIALIGSACRFGGGCNSPAQLGDRLREPRDVRSEMPHDRFNPDGYYHPDGSHHGNMNVKLSYLLDQDPYVFDAEFFGISPIEAQATDPQHRLLLETVYEAIESAGLTVDGLRGSDTCVYAGNMRSDFETMIAHDMDHTPLYACAGLMRAATSGRVSYFFDWKGPSVTIDTACSSGLTALHYAVQSLRAGDSRVAVCCGTNLVLGPHVYVMQSKIGMLSPRGVCRMWDKEADGYARGEGVAAIVLKTLSNAIADGDDIECIIRETGVSHDGAKDAGIGAPLAEAQAALIQSVYARAGLDARNPAHYPQFIEAHGTGTQIGDPIEAEGLDDAFFGPGHEAGGKVIYTGSGKTVLGHTEATAGIAGIIRASQMMQRLIIPPNLHFNELSPRVAPFYGNLQIPTTAMPWPTLAPGQVRRVSVNSFGFGGSNAHAIVESYQEPTSVEPMPSAGDGLGDGTSCMHVGPLTPFVFSAKSDESLRDSLSAYAAHLDAHPDVHLGDLGYTLRARRSVFQHRVSFSAASMNDLKAKMRHRLADDDGGGPVGARAPVRRDKPFQVLGVFTGQGAQYPRMGAELVESSPMARRIVETLESHLAELPAEHRPKWSLKAEMLADASVSRVGEAAIAQPLCAAVQILLVDVLAAANVRFDAVVGHSSGETVAAYAAGHLSARDALVVSYYRGLHSDEASSPNGSGIAGAMMAAETSLADATELCEDAVFAGRITVAASNSSTSVTFSGDEDAIEELAAVFEDEDRFHRRLKVDRAYHSGHMLPCAGPYVESLKRAGVRTQQPAEGAAVWYSSVHGGLSVDASRDGLDGPYWSRNLTQPVLFSHALTAAVEAAKGSGSPLTAAVEVGPHPSLAGPAGHVVQQLLDSSLPYHGCLARGTDARQALSDCLGFLWQQLDPASGVPCLQRCEVALSGRGQPTSSFRLVKDLPPYRWTHGVEHRFESRMSRCVRLRNQPHHPLLGHASTDSAPHALRWKNVLKVGELPWLDGHRVQGQRVFPATGFVSTAIEAARFLAPGQQWAGVRMVEVFDFQIHRPITFEEEDTGVEVHVELSKVPSASPKHLTAKFTYSAVLTPDDLSLTAEGRVVVCLGEAALDLLPQCPQKPPSLITVEPSLCYSHMQSLGLDFSGPFRSLTSVERKLDEAFCVVKKATTPSTGPHEACPLLVHPVDLDAALQAVMAAYSYPGDGRISFLHLPSSIGTMRANPAVLAHEEYAQSGHYTISTSTHHAPSAQALPGSGFSGEAAMQASCPLTGRSSTAVQLSQIEIKSLGSQANNGSSIVQAVRWLPERLDSAEAARGIRVTQHHEVLRTVLCRFAIFFLGQINSLGAARALTGAPMSDSVCKYVNFARHVTELVRLGKCRWADKKWSNDCFQDLEDQVREKGLGQVTDVRFMFSLGEALPAVLNNETSALEVFRSRGLMDPYYAGSYAMKEATQWIANIVKQATDKNPHLDLIEIGAGTGAATTAVLRAIGDDFHSYTFTDISSAFFDRAANALEPWSNRLVFKTYDAEMDPLKQGFEAGIYDVVMSFLVIHSCARLDETLRHLRKFLRPGGLLIILEQTDEGCQSIIHGFISGALPGWWRSEGSGVNGPLCETSSWDPILKRSGFSGVDGMWPSELLEVFGIAAFVSTAVDERVDFIRNPTAAAAALGPIYDSIVIIGGVSPPVARLARTLADILRPLAGTVSSYVSLENMDPESAAADSSTTIIGLTELEQSVFEDMTPERWYKLRRLFRPDNTVLWLTSDRMEDEPLRNMVVGLGAYATREENMRMQCLDVADVNVIDARAIAETLLCFTNTSLDNKDLFYTKEPEILIDAEGRRLVPRLFPVADANDRIASAQQPIYRHRDVSGRRFELQQDDQGCFLRMDTRYDTELHDMPGNDLDLHTTHAILSAIRGPAGHRFVALGVDRKTGDRYLASVSSLASALKVDMGSAVICNDLCGLPEAALLSLFAAHLISMAIIDPLHPGQRAHVHNASDVVAAAIYAQASAKGVAVAFSTDSAAADAPESWIKIAPFPRPSDVGRVVPTGTACFVGLSVVPSENERALASGLPPQCRMETLQTMLCSKADDAGEAPPTSLMRRHFERALNHVRDHKAGDHNTAGNISLESLVSGQGPEDALSIIDWTSLPATLPVKAEGLESRIMFHANQTYWLVGLTGELGLSLCDWMARRGARFIVLSSRDPKIDPRWVEDHLAKGVKINIYSCDVTDQEALKTLHRTVVETLPPIAGLMHGAMVLEDVAIRNMDYDQMMNVMRPKVLGGIYLDRLFYDIDVDFFVFFSSISIVVGTVGQANYSAANVGLSGVARNRRKRGLRASVVHLGTVLGLGYFSKYVRSRVLTGLGAGAKALSEQEFHQIMAESIEAGNLDSPDGPEIWTGLQGSQIATEEEGQAAWLSVPKFNRLQSRSTVDCDDRRVEPGTSVSTIERLRACRTDTDVIEVMRESFCGHLRKALMVLTSDDDLMTSFSTELGLDSLISVDIRTYFLKVFKVHIPVLKIMASNAPMSALVEMAAAELPAELIPQVRPQSVSVQGGQKSKPAHE